MSAPRKIITIGDTGKGGWWYAIDDQLLFGDGLPTEGAAIEAALTAAGTMQYEIWYQCEAGGKAVMIPGAQSESEAN